MPVDEIKKPTDNTANPPAANPAGNKAVSQKTEVKPTTTAVPPAQTQQATQKPAATVKPAAPNAAVPTPASAAKSESQKVATPAVQSPAAAKAQIPQAPAAAPKKEEFTGAPVKTKNVIVIDNDKNLMHEITEFTKRKAIKEINFIFAENAKVCLEKMKQQKPDLVVIELLLPIVSGYYLLKIFEKESIPAIIYTTLHSPDDLKKMGESKASNIFLKTMTKAEDIVQFVKSRDKYDEDLKTVIDKLQKEMKAMEGKDDKGHVKVVQCPKCNTILAPQSHFCNNCGQKLVREQKQIPVNTKTSGIKPKQ